MELIKSRKNHGQRHWFIQNGGQRIFIHQEIKAHSTVVMTVLAVATSLLRPSYHEYQKIKQAFPNIYAEWQMAISNKKSNNQCQYLPLLVKMDHWEERGRQLFWEARQNQQIVSSDIRLTAEKVNEDEQVTFQTAKLTCQPCNWLFDDRGSELFVYQFS